MKPILFVTILLALLLSACAPATPTVDPGQIQASAVAAANTMVALTQAAIPTETPVPPTQPPSPTPLPIASPTLLALPTLNLTTQTTVNLPTQAPASGPTAAGGDPCQAPLASNPQGAKGTLHIVNAAKAPIILSLYLSKSDFGECGYKSFNIDTGGSQDASMPKGCYSGGAFVNDPKKPTKSFGAGCFTSDNKWVVTVRNDGVITFSQ